MAENTLIDKLRGLMENSPALNSLPEEEKNERVYAILAVKPDQMKQIIKIFEDEAKYLKEIDEDFEGHMGEIKEYIDETNQIVKDAERNERHNKEKLIRKEEEAHAENILKKLDEII
ncbi:hypothetical protein JW911_00920 [Candidatus Peregrinibacteria bacterium]|nr:hypothetical protein [Candidatus Peregrinibacteria bacterium]